MKEYHKIQTVFKRDMENKGKTLLIGQWTLPEFEYLAGNQWVYTEKVDGTNIRIMFDGDKVSFGGKTDNAAIPAKLVERLRERFPDGEAFKSAFDCGGVCLYGEGYGAGIQKGGTYRPNQDFVLFDILISNAEYDTIKTCPKHHELINATLSDLTSLKGFVNPAITGTLRSKILSGQQTSSAGLLNTTRPSVESKTANGLGGNATSRQNSELASKNTTECCQSKAECAPFVQEPTTGTGGEGKSCHSPSIIATKQAESEGCCAQPAIQRFIKQSETLHGSMLPECTCKINDWWLQREDVEDVAAKLDLDIVPVIGRGTLHECIDRVRGGLESMWGNFQAEGIVARPATELVSRGGHRIIAKIKCRDFSSM